MYEKISKTTDSEIAELIKSRRKSMRLTQKQTAEKAGLALRHYQHFENCERSLLTASFSTTMAILDALEINAKAFISIYVLSNPTEDVNR